MASGVGWLSVAGWPNGTVGVVAAGCAGCTVAIPGCAVGSAALSSATPSNGVIAGIWAASPVKKVTAVSH
jgi:hypothetical protein